MLSELALLLTVAQTDASARFVAASEVWGLGIEQVPASVSRLCFADLNDDGWPDVVLDRHLVYLNVAAEEPAGSRTFRAQSHDTTHLLEPEGGRVTIFCDVDGDGRLDAVHGEYVDLHREGWTDHGRRSGWQRGRGDGTFEEPRTIAGLQPATTSALAAGDVDLDGRVDLFFGNWYVQYGGSYLGYGNELACRDAEGEWVVERLPANAPSDPELELDEDLDPFGRPTYGALIARLWGGASEQPELLELNYGRRWNRVWTWTRGGWRDRAPGAGLDGDGVRHGRYPEWAIERMAQREPPIELEPEKPFRSNGNSFDCAVGDVDGDGDFDLLLADITHGWAGEASDRTRLFVNRSEQGERRFEVHPTCDLDRIPEGVNNWNQGDLFCALADLDHDTRLDLLVCSGDYPDDQRLRVWLQQAPGAFADRTAELGLDHDGCHQVSLGDVDGDGDLDLLVGQTFFRYTAEMKEGRTPRPRLFLNELTEGRGSITLRLEGDGERVNRDALGAIAHVRLPGGTEMHRQLVGPGGHAGKQNDFLIHFGLGEATRAAALVVQWPQARGATQQFKDVEPGRYALAFGGELRRLDGDRK